MSKLFCDCKTDEEKSNFFLSGQGVETGIIAPAISNEIAMAFHRCFEFEKQLAAAIAALAACKAKDEAMREFIAALDGWTLDDLSELKREAVEKALTIQPDDSALKAWLGKAVCFYDGNTFYADERSAVLCMADMSNLRPLYHPKELK